MKEMKENTNTWKDNQGSWIVRLNNFYFLLQ